jgi:hypothetical protein
MAALVVLAVLATTATGARYYIDEDISEVADIVPSMIGVKRPKPRSVVRHSNL